MLQSLGKYKGSPLQYRARRHLSLLDQSGHVPDDIVKGLDAFLVLNFEIYLELIRLSEATFLCTV